MKHSYFVVFFLLVFTTAASFGQSKDQDIRTLLNLMHADRIAIQTMDAIIPAVEKMAPEVPPNFWKEFRKSVDPKSLIDLMVPVYARYYSDDDVRQLIAFYRSPIGQKVVEVTPAITKDGFAVGNAWGEDLAKKLLEKIRDSGYKVSQISKPRHIG